MKKLLIVIITPLLLWISCDVEDSLDIRQRGVLDLSTYTNADDETTESFIAAVYFQLHGSVFEETFANGIITCIANLRSHLDTRGGDLSNYNTYIETSETAVFANIWSYYYKIIYMCNMIIENLPNNQVASTEVKDRVVAEARAIRAIMMMYLVQLYGNPPLADHVITGTESNTPASESWTFIESELNAAAVNLPSKSDINSQSMIGGRLTKEAAFAYLGKAHLWQGDYDDAASVLHDKVIATGLYGLVSEFSELNSYTADFCKEYIWECEITNDPAYTLSQAGQFDLVMYNWSPNYMKIPDGIYKSQGFGTDNGTSESFGTFMDQHDVISDNKSDRYKATLASYEDILDPTLFTYSDGAKGVEGIGVEKNEGYFRIKFIPRAENVMGAGFWVYDYLHNNVCYMRYAEVLLNYAEAVANGGNDGSILSGLEALNEVRNRAGIPDAPSLDMNNEEYGVKAEKRAELFYEGNRFIDLVRWGDAQTVLADCGTYTPRFYGYLDGNNDSIQVKANWNIVKVPSLGEGFVANKHELFPIPLVERNNNPNLEQNPNW
ncbi:MAG: RagB/SusD family nutrient uptake outer membrane protein [Bacteroidales bacterium]|nr:RagB/SusD family nutrient uptake outer membrane protein [Bacteroidales bacterium]